MCKTNLLGFCIFFKHWKIVYITKTIRFFLYQTKLLSQFGTNHTSIVSYSIFLICHKENGIANLKTCQCLKFFFAILRNKLINWSLVRTILKHFQIAKSAHANTCGKLQQFFMEAFGHICMNLNSAHGLSNKWLKRTFLEKLCHINNSKRIAKVWFICTKL